MCVLFIYIYIYIYAESACATSDEVDVLHKRLLKLDDVICTIHNISSQMKLQMQGK